MGTVLTMDKHNSTCGLGNVTHDPKTAYASPSSQRRKTILSYVKGAERSTINDSGHDAIPKLSPPPSAPLHFHCQPKINTPSTFTLVSSGLFNKQRKVIRPSLFSTYNPTVDKNKHSEVTRHYRPRRFGPQPSVDPEGCNPRALNP